MNSEQWKSLYRETWGKDHAFLKKDSISKIGEGRHTIRSFNKTIYLECTPETKLFYFLYRYMIYGIKYKDEVRDLEGIDDLQTKVKQVRLVERLGKHGFHYNIKRPIAKLLVPSIKGQYRLYDDLDGDNWDDYIMHGEKVRIYTR